MIIDSLISSQIQALIKQTQSLQPQEAEKAFADGLSAIICNAIRSGLVTVTVPILPVQVVPVTGTGATLSPIPTTGTIS